MYDPLYVVLTRNGEPFNQITFSCVSKIWVCAGKVELCTLHRDRENETFRTVDSNDWLISVSHILKGGR